MITFLNKKNFAYGFILDNPLLASATTINLFPGDGVRFPSTNFEIVVWNYKVYGDASLDPNREIILCTSRSGDVLTVVRAQEGTVASDHVFGSKIIIPVTAGTFTEYETALGVSILGKTLIPNEVPSGTFDGSNKVFTLANDPYNDSLFLALNGQLLTKDEDYSLSGNQITLLIDYTSSDIFRAYYFY